MWQGPSKDIALVLYGSIINKVEHFTLQTSVCRAGRTVRAALFQNIIPLLIKLTECVFRRSVYILPSCSCFGCPGVSRMITFWVISPLTTICVGGMLEDSHFTASLSAACRKAKQTAQHRKAMQHIVSLITSMT